MVFADYKAVFADFFCNAPLPTRIFAFETDNSRYGKNQ